MLVFMDSGTNYERNRPLQHVQLNYPGVNERPEHCLKVSLD